MNKKHMSIQTGALALGLVVSALAGAQESDGLGEIVVTAQKRAQSLSDVPISVTAFSAEDIEKNKIEKLQDYVEKTPNVGYFTSGNTTGDRLAIRGVSNVGGFANSLGIYVDEFNVTPLQASTTYDQNLLDLERIEVLRGPQGVLFGRNLIGGAISLTTKKPDFDRSAELRANYGSFDSWMLNGSVNVPVVDGLVAVRATGFWRESDGFIRDIGPAGNTNDYEGKGARLAVRITPSENLTIDLTGSHSEYDQGMNNFIPSGQLNAGLGAFRVTSPIDDGQGFWPSNSRTIATDTPTFADNNTTIFTARAELDLGSMSLVSNSGYIENESGRSGDGDFTASTFYIDDVGSDLESYSTELRLQSNEGGRFDWVVGATYAHDQSSEFSLRTLYPLFLQRFGLTGTRRINDFGGDSLSESYAAFSDVTWHVSDAVALSLGGRFTHAREFAFRFTDSENFFTGIPLGSFKEGTREFDDFSPRVTALYRLDTQKNLYATVSKGFKAGGFNAGSASLPDVPQDFDKETAWNYEVGAKTFFFDRRLRANVSVFYMKWDDIQVTSGFLDANRNPRNTILNAAEASSKGVELDLTARPLSNLELQVGAGYNDAKFDSFPAAISEAGTFVDASGNSLPLAPEWTFNGSAEYGFPVFADYSGFVRTEYSYRAEVFTTSLNVSRLGEIVPSYDKWNLRAGVENDRYRFVAYVENLLDDNYLVGGFSTFYMSGNAVVVDPRRFGVQVAVKF